MITHKEIFGWFDTMSEHVYRTAVDRFADGATFVEIGAYMGQSTCFMAQEIKRRNKKIKFDVIDHFNGSVEHQGMLKGKNLYEIFIENMKNAEVLDDINIIRMDCNEAVKLYQDNSLDFVFIDGGHSYEEVKNDIQKWLPKVKIGGVLCGDDYHKNHPGVIKAVEEIFANTKRMNGRIWLFDK